jgi:hypothetical protein
VLNPGEFPGNSNIRWDATISLWKYNWQTVCPDSGGENCPPGEPIPAANGGTDYCLTVISQKTGQEFPSKERPVTVRP